MRASLRDLFQYAKTGIPSPGMRPFDKLLALQQAGSEDYPETTITGVSPISFKGDGNNLTAWSVKGKESQTGTPAPSNKITPDECGDLIESGAHSGEYALQITVGGTTHTAYMQEPIRNTISGNFYDTLSSAGTITRKIRKKVFDGTETIGFYNGKALIKITDGLKQVIPIFSTHYQPTNAATADMPEYSIKQGPTGYWGGSECCIMIYDPSKTSSGLIQNYLQTQYENGTPVCCWYVLSEATTESITVPTLKTSKGNNTISVGTTLAPSEISITGHLQAIT